MQMVQDTGEVPAIANPRLMLKSFSKFSFEGIEILFAFHNQFQIRKII
jgi:hypothetical protein